VDKKSPGCSVMLTELTDGKIVRGWFYWDQLALLTQLGITPDTVALGRVGGMVCPVTVANRSAWVPLPLHWTRTRSPSARTLSTLKRMSGRPSRSAGGTRYSFSCRVGRPRRGAPRRSPPTGVATTGPGRGR
jgi:hypothetical protein